MIELIYPYDNVPLIPAPTAETVATQEVEGELLPIVEPSGLVVGQSSRQYCHSGAKVLHPVVHLHIIDRYSRIYLQKRPLWKDIQPGKWDTAVGGHVDYGEEVMEALFREASEELSLVEFHPIHILTYEFESQVEKELVIVFAAVGSYELKPHPTEVEEGRWWPVEEIDSSLGKDIFTPNFESEYSSVRNSLLALL